jgi:hypothetical protein
LLIRQNDRVARHAEDGRKIAARWHTRGRWKPSFFNGSHNHLANLNLKRPAAM